MNKKCIPIDFLLVLEIFSILFDDFPLQELDVVDFVLPFEFVLWSYPSQNISVIDKPYIVDVNVHQFYIHHSIDK